MDQMRAIEYFLRVVTLGSFAKAAHQFNVSPPAVTKLIAALERELGVTLLRRSSRQISLTTDGEIFFPACANAVAELRAAMQRLTTNQTRPSGKLVVGMARIVGQYVAPFLAEFLAQHSELTLDVRLVQNPQSPLAQTVDVLVFIGWPQNTDMFARRVAQTKFLTCASPAYWKAHGVPQDPDELHKHRCLVFRTPWNVVLDLWKYRRGTDTRTVAIQPRMVADDRQYIIDAAIRGAGVVRIADIVPRYILHERLLLPVFQDWEALEAPPIYLLYRRRPPERVRLLVDFLTDLFANLPSVQAGEVPKSLAPAPIPPHFRRKWVGPLSVHTRTLKRGRPKLR